MTCSSKSLPTILSSRGRDLNSQNLHFTQAGFEKVRFQPGPTASSKVTLGAGKSYHYGLSEKQLNLCQLVPLPKDKRRADHLQLKLLPYLVQHGCIRRSTRRLLCWICNPLTKKEKHLGDDKGYRNWSKYLRKRVGHLALKDGVVGCLIQHAGYLF